MQCVMDRGAAKVRVWKLAGHSEARKWADIWLLLEKRYAAVCSLATWLHSYAYVP